MIIQCAKCGRVLEINSDETCAPEQLCLSCHAKESIETIEKELSALKKILGITPMSASEKAEALGFKKPRYSAYDRMFR